jgi:hypothetical protein
MVLGLRRRVPEIGTKKLLEAMRVTSLSGGAPKRGSLSLWMEV